MKLSDRLSTILSLAMLAYLGFYVFGLVMGVYGAGEVLYLTIPAVVFAIIVLFQFVRRDADSPVDDVNQKARHLRESRGF